MFPPSHQPARLSQKMLLNWSGLLKAGEPAGSVLCSRAKLGIVVLATFDFLVDYGTNARHEVDDGGLHFINS